MFFRTIEKCTVCKLASSFDVYNSLITSHFMISNLDLGTSEPYEIGTVVLKVVLDKTMQGGLVLICAHRITDSPFESKNTSPESTS